MIDQGDADSFYPEQLLPGNLQQACASKGQELILRMQPGYIDFFYLLMIIAHAYVSHAVIA